MSKTDHAPESAITNAEAELDVALAAYRAARDRGREHQRKYVSLTPSPRGAWHLAQWRAIRPRIRRLFDECVAAQEKLSRLRRED